MKKIQKTIFILLTILTFINCSKTATDSIEYIDFAFVDEQGNDVFTENNIYGLSISDYHVSPRRENDSDGYRHILYQGINYFTTFFIGSDESKTYTTYLKFGNINTDTIKIKWGNPGNIKYIKQLWYNGKELQIHNNHTYECDTQTITFKVD